MRLKLGLPLLCLTLAASLFAQMPDKVPQMHTVKPDNGKIGSVLHIQGIYLGKASVDEVYLTDHTFDMKVKVMAQSEDSIDIRIPPSAKPGRLELLVKTTGKEPLLIEQPVYITVQEPKDTSELASASK